MKLSVWNPAIRAYVVYESNQVPVTTGGGGFGLGAINGGESGLGATNGGESDLGAVPDELMGLLPGDSVEIGVSESPEGQIVKTTIGVSGFFTFVAAGVVARLIYSYISGK